MPCSPPWLAAARRCCAGPTTSAAPSGSRLVVLLPHTDLGGSREVAEKLRAVISGTPIEVAGAPVRFTLSVGAAMMDPDMEDIETLLFRAEEALLRARHMGGDRCVAWTRTEGATRAARRRVLKAGMITFNDAALAHRLHDPLPGRGRRGLDLFRASGMPQQLHAVDRQRRRGRANAASSRAPTASRGGVRLSRRCASWSTLYTGDPTLHAGSSIPSFRAPAPRRLRRQ